MTTEESREGKQQVWVRLERAVITPWVLGRGWQGQCSVRTAEPKPSKGRLDGDEAATYKPQDRFTGAAVFKRDHIANFVTDINIHFVGNPQGQLHRRLLVDLCAYHAPVLVVDGKAVFSAPLRNL